MGSGCSSQRTTDAIEDTFPPQQQLTKPPPQQPQLAGTASQGPQPPRIVGAAASPPPGSSLAAHGHSAAGATPAASSPLSPSSANAKNLTRKPSQLNPAAPRNAMNRSRSLHASDSSEGVAGGVGNSLAPSSAAATEKERAAFDGSISAFLHDHVLFKNLDESFIAQLNNAMQSRIYGANEYVVRKGEEGRAMFFILRGEVEVVSEDGETILNVMREQSFFGEIGVLFSVPRTASCRARGRCIILALTKEKLQKILESYPKVAEAINLIAEERFALHKKQQEKAMKVEFKDEIKIGMTNRDLKSIPLFRDCDVGFLHKLALNLKPVQFQQGEIIVRKGDIAGEMYFVVDGVAEVFNEEDNKVYAEFQPGTFFGEVGLFFKIKRIASVRCQSPVVTVFELLKQDLDTLLAEYPDIDVKLKLEAKQRFEYNKVREVAKLTGKQEVETDIEVVREKLKQIPILKGGSVGFYHQLALALKLKVHEPGELILRKDEPGRCMYFVVDGSVEVISEDGKTVYGEMPANTFFGEVALFFEVNRTASVRSKTACTLFELHKEELKNILLQHKQLKEQMTAAAEENYSLWQSRQKEISDMGQKDSHEFDVEATVDRLRRVPIFHNCSENFLRGLATHTSVHTHNMGDVIVRTGELSNHMYFIVHGKVEIISDSGTTVFDTVSEGGFFGEVGIIRGVARTASVRVASATCDVMTLSADALKRMVDDFPESFQPIVLEADKRFQLVETRKLAAEHALHMRQEPVTPGATSASHGQHLSSGTSSQASSPDMSGGRRSRATSAGDKKPGIMERSSSFGQLFKRKGSKTVESGLKPGEEEVGKSKRLSLLGSKDAGKGSRDTVIDQPAPASSASNATSQDKHGNKFGQMFKNIKNTFSKGQGAKVQPQKDQQSKPTRDASAAAANAAYAQKMVARPKAEHIFDLNDADIAVIFSYINPQQRMRLRLSCHRFASVLSDPRSWTVLNFKTLFTTCTPDWLARYSDLSGDFLTSLNLDSCFMIADDEMINIAANCPNVVQLAVPNCWKLTDRGLAYCAQNMTKIKDLNLSYCGQLNGVSFVDHRWAGLTKLNLTYCKQIADVQLEKILCRTSEITDLRLKRCTRITDFGVFLVVRYCRHLSTLDLSDCEQVSDKCLKWIASSCYNLVNLSLRFCTRITNGGLYDLSLGCQTFHSLDLSHCVNLTDAAIVFFSDSIRKLRVLKLRRCRKLTDSVANFLMRAAPQLRLVDFTGCPNITVQAKLAMEMTLKSARVELDAHREGGKSYLPSPEERGRPRATEVLLEHLFWSGPADRIRIPLEEAAKPPSQQKKKVKDKEGRAGKDGGSKSRGASARKKQSIAMD